MKVIILAAGTGSRLMPYTINKPKALVELANKPLLEYQLSVFNKLGLSDINLVVGYLYHHFDHYAYPQFINTEYEQSNMLHSLMQAVDVLLSGEDVIICYGDIIYQPEVLSKLLATKGDVVVAADKQWQSLWELRMEDPLADAESFIYNDQGKVIELGKPLKDLSQAQAQYIGLLKISGQCSSKVVQAYKALGLKETKNMYLTDFIQNLIDKHFDVRASLHNRGWLEVDTSQDLHIYNRLVADKQFNKLGVNSDFINSF